MNLDLLLDPLFIRPFFTGLTWAICLPVLGLFLRLRGEWLAALGLAQLASAGALVGMVLHVPLLAAGLGAAALAAVFKTRLPRDSEQTYALIMTAAWALGVLLLHNHPAAEQAGQRLFDGQLYFTGTADLVVAAVLLGVTAALLPRVSRPLLLSRLLPAQGRAQRVNARRHALIFDMLAALAITLATFNLGVMASFALVFVPAWAAFRRGGSWAAALAWSIGLGVSAHVLAFATALLLDQPFGPVLALMLVGAGLLVHGRRR